PRAPLAAFLSTTAPASTPGLFLTFVERLKSSDGVRATTPAELWDAWTVRERDAPPPEIFVVDVREPYEWNEDHIPGAVYTGRGNLEKMI
ncbi:hypothetical protein HK405_000942, partial [Cladochytrium tenue]